jgi:ligand-binding sensor domain-containing protein
MISQRIGFFAFIQIGIAFSQARIPDREIQYRPGDWVSFPVLRHVSSLAMDQNLIYTGTTGGIGRYDFYRREWDIPYTWSDGLDGSPVRCISYDFDSGYLWCATETGLNFRIPGAEQWRQISYRDAGIPPVSAIGTGRNYLWLRCGDTFYRTDHTGDRFESAPAAGAPDDAVLWRGGTAASLPQLFMDGGRIFDRSGTIMDTDLRRYELTGSLQDEFRNLWVGTAGLGMGWADLNSLRLQMLPFGLYQPDVRAAAADAGGMWIGGLHDPETPGGITRWSMDGGEWSYYEATYTPGLRSDQVTYIVPDSDCVWFATLNGLVRYDRRRMEWGFWNAHQNLWSDEVLCLALGDSALWIGTRYGVNRLRLPGMILDQMRDPGLNNRRVYGIETDGDWVWAGTDRGLFRYSRSGNAWTHLKGYTGMLVQEVYAVSVWGNETWFATDDGVEVYDKSSDQWRGFSKNQYPTAGPFNVIVADSDVVWLGTEGRGVLKYLKSENRWRTFTTGDGLLDDSVRAIIMDGDYVWFGTAKGLTRFYWDSPFRRD